MTEEEFMNKLDQCFISRRRKNDMAIKDAVSLIIPYPIRQQAALLYN